MGGFGAHFPNSLSVAVFPNATKWREESYSSGYGWNDFTRNEKIPHYGRNVDTHNGQISPYGRNDSVALGRGEEWRLCRHSSPLSFWWIIPIATKRREKSLIICSVLFLVGESFKTATKRREESLSINENFIRSLKWFHKNYQNIDK